MGVDWAFLFEPDLVEALLAGVEVTVALTVLSALGALGIGVLVSWMRLSASKWAKAAGDGYVGLVRNVPILVQLFFVYFGLTIVFPASEYPILRSPYLGSAIAVLTIALAMGGFVAEVIRGGVEAIPMGQVEAALATGMSRNAAYRDIVAPQLLPIILPGLSNEMVNTLKSTTFAMTIGVSDLMWQAQRMESQTFRGVEIMTAVTLVYFVLSYLILAFFWSIERVCRLPGQR